MKKIFLGLFVLIAVFSFAVVLVKAEETSVALADGVQIRTDGNNGLRWEATVTHPEEGQVYGFLFAQGELTAEQLNKDTVNVVKKEVEGLKEDGKYHATMVKFPTSAVVQDITVRAYVRTGEEYEYSDNVVTRNLAEVAVYSKNTTGGEFVNNVVEYVNTNFKKVYTNSHNAYFIDSAIYESNYALLKVAFINDWNECFDTSLDSNTAFVVSNYNSIFETEAIATKITDSKLYKFFNHEVYKEKWGWLLTYFEEQTDVLTASSYVKNQFNAIKNGTSDLADGDWYKGQHFISYLLSLFNGKYSSTGFGGYRFENKLLVLANLSLYNDKIYANNENTLFVKIGENIVLPEKVAGPVGYEWAGWSDGSLKYEALSSKVVDSNLILIPSYTPITYSIKYFDGETELNNFSEKSYNIESANITLPTYVKEGYTFEGWYTDPEFTEKVTTITKGSYGDVVLYAKTSKITGYTITYVLNGGNTVYANKDEVVADLFKDISTYKGKTYTPSSLGVMSGIYSINNLYQMFQEPEYNAKWLWLLEFFAATETNSYNKFAYQYLSGQKTSGWNSGQHPYSVEYVIAGFANNNSYSKNPSFATADYSLASNNNFWSYLQKTDKIEQLNCSGTVTLNNVIYKVGYIFDGWYTTSDFKEDTKVTSVTKGTTVYAKWIDVNSLATIVELSDADLEAIETTLPTKIVNASFTSGIYSINGANYVVGDTAFAKVSDALAVATQNDKIYVFSGTYSDALTIAASNVLLYGPNYNVHGNETRNEEANITALTTINAANVTINGLKFTSAGNIKVGANNVTITNIYMRPSTTVACNGKNRQGCIVDSATISDLTVSNSYINAPGTVNSYAYQFMSFNIVSNLTITGNYIANDSQVTINADYAGMRIYTLSGTFNFSNNEVNWATDGYVINLANVSAATKVDFIENKFDGNATVDHSATVTVRTGAATTTINFIGNEFYNFYGGTINLSGDKGSTTNIMYNYYASTTKFSFSTRGSSKITYVDNYYAGGINTNVSPTDAGKITSKEALDAAYESYLASLK